MELQYDEFSYLIIIQKLYHLLFNHIQTTYIGRACGEMRCSTVITIELGRVKYEF